MCHRKREPRQTDAKHDEQTRDVLHNDKNVQLARLLVLEEREESFFV